MYTGGTTHEQVSDCIQSNGQKSKKSVSVLIKVALHCSSTCSELIQFSAHCNIESVMAVNMLTDVCFTTWCLFRRYDGDNTGNIDDKEMMMALAELGVLDPKVCTHAQTLCINMGFQLAA